MHWLDTTLLTLMGLASILGFVTGFFWQVARVLGLGLALWLCIVVHEPATRLLHSTFLQGVDDNVARAVAYIVVFISGYLAIFLLCRMLREGLKQAGLDLFDRLLGSMLGLAKMIAILGGVSLLLTHINHPGPQAWLEESTIAPVLATGMERSIELVPEYYRKVLFLPETQVADSAPVE